MSIPATIPTKKIQDGLRAMGLDPDNVMGFKTVGHDQLDVTVAPARDGSAPMTTYHIRIDTRPEPKP